MENLKRIMLDSKTVDSLVQCYELKNHGELFQKAVLLLATLTDANKKGWSITLLKLKKNEGGATDKPTIDEKQNPNMLHIDLQAILDVCTHQPPTSRQI